MSTFCVTAVVGVAGSHCTGAVDAEIGSQVGRGVGAPSGGGLSQTISQTTAHLLVDYGGNCDYRYVSNSANGFSNKKWIFFKKTSSLSQHTLILSYYCSCTLDKKRKVSGKRYEARSCGRSSPDFLAF